jgi:hypothetical protein
MAIGGAQHFTDGVWNIFAVGLYPRLGHAVANDTED